MRGLTVAGRMKLVAAVMLGVSFLLPFYSFPGEEGGRVFRSAWQSAVEDRASTACLALAYLWPAVLFVLRRLTKHRGWRCILSVVEPVLAVASALIIVAASSTVISLEAVIPGINWVFVPVSGTPATGAWLGLLADVLYLLAWAMNLAGAFQPRANTTGK